MDLAARFGIDKGRSHRALDDARDLHGAPPHLRRRSWPPVPRLSRASAQRILALLALLGARRGPSRATSALPPWRAPQGQTGDSSALETLLRSAVTEPGRQAEVGPLAQALVASALKEGEPPGSALALAFPRPDSILSMLALDRDVDDFAEAGEGRGGAAAAHYRRAAEAAQVYRPLRANYSHLFTRGLEGPDRPLRPA